MLLNMRSITRHKRSYGHPLHPDLFPDVLTCVLTLGTVSSGRESEVESVHLFLTIIQFFSACHLTSQLTDAFQDVDAGFPIRYRFDGKLLNLRRLQAKSKVQTDVVDKLLYADDLAENAKSEEKNARDCRSHVKSM